MLVTPAPREREDLHEEIVHAERIQTEHDAANVSHSLSKYASAHGSHKRPCLVSNAVPQLPTEKREEKQHVDYVSCNIGSILDDLPRLWTSADFAVSP